MADINKQNEELISVPDREMENVNGGASDFYNTPALYGVGQTVYYIHYTDPQVVTDVYPDLTQRCWAYTIEDDWTSHRWVKESELSNIPRPEYGIKR